MDLLSSDFKEIYYGNRGEDFVNLLKNVLIKGNMKDKYIKDLLSKENLEEYNKVFTRKEVDIENNYEVYEQLGDSLAGQFIVFYSYRKFPQLNSLKGIKIVARIKINYGSKETFSKIAEKLGFWDFITAPVDIRKNLKKSLLEDTFEAFLGATCWILDKKYINGVGFSVVYDILETIFNEQIDIKLTKESLFDSISILKEIFDKPEIKQNYGNLKYDSVHNPETKITTTTIFIRNGAQILAVGDGPKVDSSKQNAAKNAIKKLKSLGLYQETDLDI